MTPLQKRTGNFQAKNFKATTKVETGREHGAVLFRFSLCKTHLICGWAPVCGNVSNPQSLYQRCWLLRRCKQEKGELLFLWMCISNKPISNASNPVWVNMHQIKELWNPFKQKRNVMGVGLVSAHYIRLFIGGQMQTRNTGYTSKNVTKPKITIVSATLNVSRNSNVYNSKVKISSISGRSWRIVAK